MYFKHLYLVLHIKFAVALWPGAATVNITECFELYLGECGGVWNSYVDML